ncbi:MULTISPECIES: peptidoglycan-binding protein [Clostridium]|mgnify:FL=1|uniref:peptidoglycan-binding domain-containing protein n=1 Tax=Clostridium TaxID=1485 RepID=UPI0012B71BDD|nr:MULTISPECIES: peptidoglycan-binding protein [Clostridium]MBX9184660.1 peptidoglycan-binding protein [Clostridium sp. K04]MDU3520061.1 peptidoglycan-binding protein [Clostridium saudiense]
MLMNQGKVDSYNNLSKRVLINLNINNRSRWYNFKNKISKTNDKRRLFELNKSNLSSTSLNSRVISRKEVEVAKIYLGTSFKIKLVQLLLNSFEWNLEIDGVCGPLTTKAIGEFQSNYGLNKDYMFGCKCFNKSYDLIKNVICKYGKYTPNETKVIQHILEIRIDGIFGSNTRALVISFQKSKGLRADGIVGSDTWAKLLEKFNLKEVI